MSIWNRLAGVVLALMILYTVVTVVLKMIRIRRARASSRSVISKLSIELRHQRVQKAIKIAQSLSQEGSHLARLVLAGLCSLATCREMESPDATTIQVVREEIEQEISRQLFEWQNGLGFLDTIGRSAPFVGAAAGSTAIFSLGTLSSVAALWFSTYLRRQIEKIEFELRQGGSEMRAFLIRTEKCDSCGKISGNMHLKKCAECCPDCNAA